MVVNMAKSHWKEYSYEFLGTAILLFLGLVGISLANLKTLPSVLKHLIVGLSFAIAIVIVVYSFLGRRSAGHINPAVTVAFCMIGSMENIDAIFYIIAQLAGAVFGSWVAFLVFNWKSPLLALILPSLDYPVLLILCVETTITLLLIVIIFSFASSEKSGKFTGLGVGVYIALVTVLFASISGASLNPARSFGPVVLLLHFNHLWIYVTGPILGAIIAVHLFRVEAKGMRPKCSKLCYKTDAECLFKCRCEYKGVVYGKVYPLDSSKAYYKPPEYQRSQGQGTVWSA